MKQLTKTVLEAALNEEITGHLGHGKRIPAGKPGNWMIGSRRKHGATDMGTPEPDQPAMSQACGLVPSFVRSLRDPVPAMAYAKTQKDMTIFIRFY